MRTYPRHSAQHIALPRTNKVPALLVDSINKRGNQLVVCSVQSAATVGSGLDHPSQAGAQPANRNPRPAMAGAPSDCPHSAVDDRFINDPLTSDSFTNETNLLGDIARNGHIDSTSALRGLAWLAGKNIPTEAPDS